MHRLTVLAILGLACALNSCVSGRVYTHITVPLDVNLNDTPVFNKTASRGDTKRIRYYVDIEWDSNAIGDIAKRAGLTEVHYADLETLSIAGIWTQRFVIIYGQ